MVYEDLKIVANRAQCTHCGDIIQSVHRHDFVTCSCGKLAVDGGKDYLKRCGYLNDYVEKSVYAVSGEQLERIVQARIEQHDREKKVSARIRAAYDSLVERLRRALP